MAKLKYLWNNFEYILAALCAAGMAASLFFQVIMRFVFRNPIAWTEELATLLFVMMVYIGSVGATRRDEHLRMTFIVNMFKEKGQLVLRIIADLCFIVVSIFLIHGLMGVTLNLKKYGMETAMLDIPKWILYFVLPVCFVAMIYRLILEIIEKSKRIKELNSLENQNPDGNKE